MSKARTAIKNRNGGAAATKTPWRAPIRLLHIELENGFQFYLSAGSVRWVVDGVWQVKTHKQFAAMLKA